MDLLGYIRENKSLNSLLSRECDIYFYHQTQEIQFSKNHEIYSLACQAFAQDGSGSEYVFLEDGSVGFVGSEGEVGRIAESLDELLTFLIHAGCISDFSCRPLYEKITGNKKRTGMKFVVPSPSNYRFLLTRINSLISPRNFINQLVENLCFHVGIQMVKQNTCAIQYFRNMLECGSRSGLV